MLAKEGYEDILYLTYIGLMNSINNLIPKRKGKGRQTVVINDEAHIINMVRTLALFKRKSIKMWRKDGCWLWDATQNIKDYPDEAIDILGVMEWLILLKMPKAELEALKKFREISAEEESIISKLTTEKGKFVEGVVLSNKVRAAFRSVPPAWYLVLGQTEEQEYTARQKLMSEHDVSERGSHYGKASRGQSMRTLALFLILVFPLRLIAADFEIFTLGKNTVTERNATVYIIDQGDELLQSINQQMRAAGVNSEEQGRRFATPELSNALLNQIRGLVKAGQYQLKYFPAVVIDGRYVIYGTTDISLYEEMKP